MELLDNLVRRLAHFNIIFKGDYFMEEYTGIASTETTMYAAISNELQIGDILAAIDDYCGTLSYSGTIASYYMDRTGAKLYGPGHSLMAELRLAKCTNEYKRVELATKKYGTIWLASPEQMLADNFYVFITDLNPVGLYNTWLLLSKQNLDHGAFRFAMAVYGCYPLSLDKLCLTKELQQNWHYDDVSLEDAIEVVQQFCKKETLW